ncbi:8517_t:CDS:2 [Funneliformis geosporum]|uniref:7724_t:CDS:1 n=1 Tax=Funneliformis geosporum TaxID=1117311 RepID=A0A9W4X5N5_9GLOM|nr:7724_t:CDS:2 [Funneliformis geosporum]CAI2188620.1 8517_t:CDS:2 [Funneliformis geosporum]
MTEAVINNLSNNNTSGFFLISKKQDDYDNLLKQYSFVLYGFEEDPSSPDRSLYEKSSEFPDTFTKFDVKSPTDSTLQSDRKVSLECKPNLNMGELHLNFTADHCDMTTFLSRNIENGDGSNTFCRHPKHVKYLDSGLINGNIALIKIPKRLAQIVNVYHKTLICKQCLKQIDKDPEYTKHPQYESPRNIRKQRELKNLNITIVGYD